MQVGGFLLSTLVLILNLTNALKWYTFSKYFISRKINPEFSFEFREMFRFSEVHSLLNNHDYKLVLFLPPGFQFLSGANVRKFETRIIFQRNQICGVFTTLFKTTHLTWDKSQLQVWQSVALGQIFKTHKNFNINIFSFVKVFFVQKKCQTIFINCLWYFDNP